MFPISDSIKTKGIPIFTIVIISFTAYIFIRQILSSDPENFILQYALIPNLINFIDLNSLTPFITAIFLHGGFLHILSNMWFLWIFGDDVEETIGFILYPILYLTAGIVGNVVQYLLMQNSNIPMLGASGAVAGILGAYYILFPHSKIKVFVPVFFFPAVINIPAPIMLGYWFILQLIAGASSLPLSGQGGIAFFAHVGGFIAGAVFVRLFSFHKKVYE